MTTPHSIRDTPPVGHPYWTEIDAERRRWYELSRLVRSLTPAECLVPGYYREPDWTIRDVVAHLGTWLAETQVQLERIAAGTYEPWDVDVDNLNAELRAGMQGQPWEVAWVQAQSARSWMLQAWFSVREPSAEAAWWIRKGAAEHYSEHLPRLLEWAAELVAERHPAKTGCLDRAVP